MIFEPHWPKRVALTTGTASCLLGLAVLVGWFVHSAALIQISPSLAPMQRMTALGFVLCGLALIFISTGRRRAAAACAAFPLLIAALTCVEYVFDADFGIDQILGKAYITVLAPRPGRMSPVTAVCFLLITSALATVAFRSLARYVSAILGIVGSLVVTVGTVSGLSYVLAQKDVYAWGHIARVALHTRAGFLLLGVGLLAVAWKEKPQSSYLPSWLPLSIGLAVAVGVLGLWQAFIVHEESRFALLSFSLLVGGFVLALLFALTVYLAQEAWDRNRKLVIYRMAFDNSFDGLMLTSPDGSIQAANPSACRTLGRTEQEICQAGRDGIMDTDDPRFQVFLEQRMQTGKAHGELNAKRKDGTLIPVEASSVIFRDASGELRTSLAMRDITARKQAEQKLREQAALLELAHDAVIVRDLQSRVAFWNRGAKDTYGWSAEEALGRSTHELLRTEFPIPFKEIEAILQTAGQWEGELVHTTRAGRTIVVTSRWSQLRDEAGAPRTILEINRDITERKHAESELRVQTERLSLATRAASIGVWDLDLRTNLTIWDDTLFAMFGLPKMVPMPYENWARLVHPDDLPGAEASLQRVMSLKTQDYCEFRIIRPDGALRYVSSAQGAVLDEQGNVSRIVGIGVDISERKRLEAQLAASARLSALGMMAGGVAHEVNNPLTIIHASASDLLDTLKHDGKVPLETVTRAVTRIRQTADRIAKIVKSLRRISREGSQDQFFPVSAQKIVEETLEMCQERFKAHSVTLRVPLIDPGLLIACREVQIAQVLLNLLTNAFDAVSGQPGEKWVRLDVQRRDGSIVFSVIDSGPGIPPEIKTRIMQPFFTTKEAGKGTGLGLSLSQTIAEEHGGMLQLTEDQGHTCFSLTLPISRKAESLCS